ncbi:hypothetical protein [Viscerimonas tarda]
MTEIKYHRAVLLYLDELTDRLIEKGYFSFYGYSVRYIEDLVNYIRHNIATKPHKPAPAYFSKYGSDLFYITWNRNKRTTWYIFFQKTNSFYFIRHITNNHVDGKFLD